MSQTGLRKTKDLDISSTRKLISNIKAGISFILHKEERKTFLFDNIIKGIERKKNKNKLPLIDKNILPFPLVIFKRMNKKLYEYYS